MLPIRKRYSKWEEGDRCEKHFQLSYRVNRILTRSFPTCRKDQTFVVLGIKSRTNREEQRTKGHKNELSQVHKSKHIAIF